MKELDWLVVAMENRVREKIVEEMARQLVEEFKIKGEKTIFMKTEKTIHDTVLVKFYAKTKYIHALVRNLELHSATLPISERGKIVLVDRKGLFDYAF